MLFRKTARVPSAGRGTWTALSKSLDTKQLLDMLIAVGGYRAVSMGINSAGVQLDANMAGFRFPASLR